MQHTDAEDENDEGEVASEHLRQKVDLWFSNQEKAFQKHGHISDWVTSAVTSFRELFKHRSAFNEDITQWNTSNVRSSTHAC